MRAAFDDPLCVRDDPLIRAVAVIAVPVVAAVDRRGRHPRIRAHGAAKALRRFKRIALPGLHHNAADLQRPSVQQHGIRTAGDVRIKGNPVFPDLPPAEAGRPGLRTEALRFSLGIRQKVPWHDLGFIRLVPRERAIAALPLIGQNFCAVHKRYRPEKFDPPNGFSVRADAKHTVVHADLAAVSGSLTRAEKNALIVLMKINGRN